ncbi:MAG: cytochrome c oxidase subunit II [Phycisphaerales bacterium]|nr:cytochrome c oxidase subunit II [Phycisphaerales bacterium]
MIETLGNLVNTLGPTTLAAESQPTYSWWFRNWGSTENATHSDTIFMNIWWISVAWFVFLMALMVYFVIRYRRRPGVAAPYSASHNTALEVAWTVIPCFFLTYMFLAGFHGYIEKMIAPGDAIEMNLTAKKWDWTITYPNGASSPERTVVGAAAKTQAGDATPGARPIPIFYMPGDTPVKFKMVSQDVMHSFWVPDFRIKMDIFPNRYTTYWFQAKGPDQNSLVLKDSTGKDVTTAQGEKVHYNDHYIFCAEYCGDQHSEMWGIIRVVPRAYYAAKIEEWNIEGKSPEEIGKLVYQSQGCVACHTVDGSKGAAPTWKDLFGNTVPTNAGPTLADENYIRESIYTPTAKIHEGYPSNMPVFTTAQIDERRMQGLIAYIKSISSKAPKSDAAAPATTDPKDAPKK